MISTGVYSRNLIGRSRELGFLLSRAGDLGERAGCIVVRGEAGIGKTRLIAEFLGAVAEDGFDVGAGAVREYANGPYAAIAEALDALALTIPEIPRGAVADTKLLWYASVADALRRHAASRSRGLIVALDDLQWADVATIDLLRYCAAQLTDARVLFVIAYRNDEALEDDSAVTRALAAIERDADILTLNPLADGQIERLIMTALASVERSLGDDAIAAVRDLADGRPLFAEEILRGLLERIDRGESGETSVPRTIRATVRERYRSLAVAERDVLVHAAVIGRRFSARFVAELMGVAPAAVYAALRSARDLQLVVEEADDAGDSFAFRHALTREAIYAELLRAETRVLHARVSTMLAAANPPDLAAVAEHAWRAADGENTALWCERAADRAAAVFAYADAARSYERAFRSTADVERRARVAEKCAEAWYAIGDMRRSTDWYANAADATAVTGRSAYAHRLSLRRARVLFESGRYDDGIAECGALTTRDADATLRFEAETMLAGLLASRGDPLAALERLRAAEALTDAAPEAAITTRLAATYAYALSALGRSSEAREKYAEAIVSARAIGDHDLVLRTYNNWANLELFAGPIARARALYDDALRTADDVKNLRQTAWLATNAGLAALVAGDLPGADALLARTTWIEHGVAIVRHARIALALRLGTLRGAVDDEFFRQAVDALDEAVSSGDGFAVCILGGALAYQHAAQRRLDDAAAAVAACGPFLGVGAFPYWAHDAAARFGSRSLRIAARERLEQLAGFEGAVSAQGFLLLADARDAQRLRDRAAATARALDAAAALASAGWRIDQGYALEAAGRPADAVALFRERGAAGEVARLTQTAATTRRRGESTLTPREREIARLVVGGHPAKAIAELLVISERTVETHVASVYRKLGVNGRRELAALLAETSAAP
ncbi:ATP-binding protein [Vulcanimicrobium alpinum]|uniref:ATP-binding protein n=1 Tax=Vulcanimicrobium alpinum TaxID=3016050 RepID=UPI00295F4862|nr:AAA family ATPase [Vulcanimicrobium alpinum]